MYNYLVERMYDTYETVVNDDNIHFVNKGRIVGTLYLKDHVLNIFLSESSDVVWNHYGLAIFVIAKKYTVLNNAKARNAEAAWLIGCCGAEWQHTLNNPMYLGTGLFWGDMKVSGISRVYKEKDCVKFNLFDLEVEWKKNEQPYSPIPYLNPALVYPAKSGGKKVKNARAYLRKEYDWEYGPGYRTAGSYEIRQFIDTKANKTNHTDWSHIKYYKVIRK